MFDVNFQFLQGKGKKKGEENALLSMEMLSMSGSYSLQ